MTDEPVQTTTLEDTVMELKAQYQTLKESFESSLAEKDTLIEQLTADNRELQRALVRSAMTPAPAPVQPKTEQELYDENIARLAAKTLEMMKKK